MSVIRHAPPLSDRPDPVPRLESGDHLSADEFRRRYTAMPNVHKAELIDGIVYMPSPVRHVQHGKPSGRLATFLGHFTIETDNAISLSDNVTLRLDDDNEPQPDFVLLLEKEFGGISKIDDDGYLIGPIEFVAEVSASTVSIDTHLKRNLYERRGVREYWDWLVEDQSVICLTLVDGRYQPIPPEPDGIVRSRVFPGLWLDPASLVASDIRKLVAVLNQGLASPKHAEFMVKLKAAKV